METDLVQEVGAMAGQPSTVIHYSWYVPGRRKSQYFIRLIEWIQVDDEKSKTSQHSLSGRLQLTDLKPDQ